MLRIAELRREEQLLSRKTRNAVGVVGVGRAAVRNGLGAVWICRQRLLRDIAAQLRISESTFAVVRSEKRGRLRARAIVAIADGRENGVRQGKARAPGLAVKSLAGVMLVIGVASERTAISLVVRVILG